MAKPFTPCHYFELATFSFKTNIDVQILTLLLAFEQERNRQSTGDIQGGILEKSRQAWETGLNNKSI